MVTASSPTFGQLLRQHRVAAGLTQEELAERAMLSVRAISDLERGVRKIPYRDTVELLADALSLSTESRTALDAAVSRRHKPAATDREPHQIPGEISSLIGREREEAEAVHLLRWGGIRLLTLTGFGGIGKTRVAIRVATSLRDDFRHGVYFVALASLVDPTLVAPTISQTLGLREIPGRSIPDMLAAHLTDKDVLLVLDNFEQVIEARGFVSDLLQGASRISMLVTSREPLHLREERVMEVPPLALPDPQRVGSSGHLKRYPGIALFLDRARGPSPDLDKNRKDLGNVTQICLRLDGLPLAIELAAAQTKKLAPDEILSLLDDSLELLGTDDERVPARQQTMRNTIAWSYGLLSTAEKETLRAVSAFVGGFNLQAAEAVVAANNGHQLDVPDNLFSLVEKSLLISEDDVSHQADTRFNMLETIREYGVVSLEEAGEAEEIRSRHAHYFLELVEEAEQHLYGPEQAAWLNRLGTEHDNIRAALRQLLIQYDAEAALRLGAAAWRFWWMRGYLSEGREWLREALQLAESASPQIFANALRAAGALALAQGDYKRSTALHEQSLDVERAIGDKRGMARSLGFLAIAAQEQGDNEAAVALHEEALVFRRELGDPVGLASGLNNFGIALQAQGDYLRAAQVLEESLSLERQLGDTRGIASTLSNVAISARQSGDFERATEALEESLVGYAEVGDRRGMAKSYSSFARLEQDRGSLDLARDYCCKGLRLSHEVGDRASIVEPIELLAELDESQRHTRVAAVLFAAAEAQRETIGIARAVSETERHEKQLAAARSRMTEAEWQAARHEGRTMGFDELVGFALGEEESH